MPIKDNVILYESFAGAGMIDSPYAIFLNFLHRTDFINYQHIWVIKKFEDNDFRCLEYADKPNVKFVTYGSDDYLKYISIAKYLINNNTFPTYWTKKKGQVYINTWHGIPRKKLFFDIPDNEMNMGNTIRNFLSADYIFSYDTLMTTAFLSGAKLADLCGEKVLSIENPRRYLALPKKKILDLLSEVTGLDYGNDNQPIAIYAPTWRGTLSKPKKSIDVGVIRALERRGYRVLVKAHHVDYEVAAEYIPPSIETSTLFPICDLLVTDYSSVFYDWDKDKPVIFYTPDYEEYVQKQGLYEDFPCAPATNLIIFEQYLSHLDDYWEKVQYKVATQLSDNGNNGLKLSISSFLDLLLNGQEIRNKRYSTKKKLLFYAGDFKPNGVTSSIIALLNRINYSMYDVSLILLKKDNPDYLEKIKEINPNVRLLTRAGTYSQTLLERCANEICLQKGIDSFKLKQMFPCELYQREWRRCFGDTHFDAIINFTGYSPFYSYFFAYGVKNSPNIKKIIWQHNIMKRDQKREANGKYPLKNSLNAVFSTYNMYDRIVSVSEQCMNENKKDFSAEKDTRYFLVHNCVASFKEMQEKMSLKNLTFEPKVSSHKVTYLNVARLSYAKNQLNLIEAFKNFHLIHKDTVLYIMGDGELKDEIEAQIKDCDFIYLIPYSKDPFTNMNYADFNILPSIYEGQGLSILEAKVLGCSTIVTNFGRDKGVTDSADILIASPSKEDIFKALEESAKDNYFKATNTNNFDEEEYNRQAIKEFETLFEDGYHIRNI